MLKGYIRESDFEDFQKISHSRPRVAESSLGPRHKFLQRCKSDLQKPIVIM